MVDNWNSVSLLNITANLFLFLPIGFFVPLIWTKCNSFKKVTFVGLTVTIFVEIVQLFTGRSTDIDDVILNTLGIMIGYGTFIVFNLIFVKPSIKKRFKTEDVQRMF
jgi:glycopeptide antibiotics resistance protein